MSHIATERVREDGNLGRSPISDESSPTDGNVRFCRPGEHTAFAADALWTKTCGKYRWLGPCENTSKNMVEWELRTVARECLVGFARQRSSQQLAVSGVSPEAIEAAKHLLDPNTLTLGFARSVATYKRPNLLLHDPERLLRLLTDSQRPVQLIVAGKAHQADLPGKAVIQEGCASLADPRRAHTCSS